MHLSDALHNLGGLGQAIMAKSLPATICACEEHISSFRYRLADETEPSSKAAFARWGSYCDLSAAIDVLQRIQAKCELAAAAGSSAERRRSKP